jgi:hypothetical protein
VICKNNIPLKGSTAHQKFDFGIIHKRVFGLLEAEAEFLREDEKGRVDGLLIC